MANRRESKPALPPYGLACIAAFLRQHGHEVKIYDMLTEGYNKEDYSRYNGQFIRYGDGEFDLWNKLTEFKPDIVGVSCIAALRHFEAVDVIKWVKEFDKNIITAIGGNHPTTLPNLVMNDCGRQLDFLVGGEGEYPMLNIANYNMSLRTVRTDLDTMPIPAHDLLPLDKYRDIWWKTSYHFYNVPGRYICASTSRGCVNKCQQCPHEAVFGRGWRPRRVKDIEAEVRFAVEELGVREVQFHEYNGQVDRKFMQEVTQMMKQFNIRWGYPIGMWVKLLDEKLLTDMFNSGMSYINLAIESISKKVLDTMPGKDVEIDYVDKVIQWSKDIGYYTNGFFMLGFPDQDLTSMKMTIDYAIGTDLDTAAFFIMQPLPGTKQYDNVEFIDGFHPMHLRYGKCNIKSKLWTAEQVEELRYQGRQDFLKSRNKPGKTVRGGNFAV
jgi:radical SAM superfamily enzyme YgiQ (UPF0313 family)